MSPEADDPRSDSAGVPWEGRSFEANPHAGDDGSADPALLAALEAFRAGTGDARAVVDAYRSARLLIPLVAEKGDEGIGAHGLPVDKTQELSIVTVEGPDGRAVLPAFTSVAAMQAWDGSARPIPIEAPRVALAAAAEGTPLVVVDPGSETEFAVRRTALRALATGEPWTPSFEDPSVLAAFERSAEGQPEVVAVGIGPGDPDARLTGPELMVGLGLRPGLDADGLAGVVRDLQERWAADPVIAEAVDSIGVRVHAS